MRKSRVSVVQATTAAVLLLALGLTLGQFAVEVSQQWVSEHNAQKEQQQWCGQRNSCEQAMDNSMMAGIQHWIMLAARVNMLGTVCSVVVALMGLVASCFSIGRGVCELNRSYWLRVHAWRPKSSSMKSTLLVASR